MRVNIPTDMREAKLVLLGLVGSLLIIYSLDCFSMVVADNQTTECCRKMPCMPGHSNHSCCKTMVAGHSPYIQGPAAHYIVTFSVALEGPLTAQIFEPCQPRLRAVEASEHGPPGLPNLFRLPLLI